MDELLDMIVSDESSVNVSDKIKDLLYAKSSDKIQNIRPDVTNNMFDSEYEESEE